MAKVHRIMGVEAPAPRITPRALWLAFRWLGVPLIAVLTGVDIVVWALGRLLFDACIGVWCWL